MRAGHHPSGPPPGPGSAQRHPAGTVEPRRPGPPAPAAASALQPEPGAADPAGVPSVAAGQFSGNLLVPPSWDAAVCGGLIGSQGYPDQPQNGGDLVGPALAFADPDRPERAGAGLPGVSDPAARAADPGIRLGAGAGASPGAAVVYRFAGGVYLPGSDAVCRTLCPGAVRTGIYLADVYCPARWLSIDPGPGFRVRSGRVFQPGRPQDRLAAGSGRGAWPDQCLPVPDLPLCAGSTAAGYFPAN